MLDFLNNYTFQFIFKLIIRLRKFMPFSVRLGFFLKQFYLLIFREGKGGRKRWRETSMCGCLLFPTGDPACSPGMCLRLGIKPATIWFTGWYAIHCATPARARLDSLRSQVNGRDLVCVIYGEYSSRKIFKAI